jgi:hypothetical protein
MRADKTCRDEMTSVLKRALGSRIPKPFFLAEPDPMSRFGCKIDKKNSKRMGFHDEITTNEAGG